jgi:taurine dioxygenase
MQPVSESARHIARMEVIPFAACLGAEVRCGSVTELDDAGVAAIRRAFLDHLVLLIRGQRLGDEDLLAFGRHLGELQADVSDLKLKPQKYPEIAVVSNVIEDGVPIGRLGDGEATWHSDISYIDAPPTASILYSLEVPPSGGDTGFANMYRALETLPASLREQIQGRTIKHDRRYTGGGWLRPGYTGKEDPRTAPGPNHPIVRRHPETGHDALYLGRRHAYVNGLSVERSEALLDALWAHATQPEFTWHHQWRVGDILMWDNRCVMHRRDAFDPQSRRVMHRTQCKGTPVVEGAFDRSPHPRSALRSG